MGKLVPEFPGVIKMSILGGELCKCVLRYGLFRVVGKNWFQNACEESPRDQAHEASIHEDPLEHQRVRNR